jgi:hypothetical protein
MFGYDPNVNVIPLSYETFALSLKVYPSPVKDQLKVSFESTNHGEVNIRVFDMTGRKIHGLKTLKDADFFEQTLSVDHLNNGLYLVEVSIGDHRSVKRIIKN